MPAPINEELERLSKALLDFSAIMLEKLKRQARKGFRGWNDYNNRDIVLEKLNAKISQINKGDFSQCRDAANYLLMLHHMDKR